MKKNNFWNIVTVSTWEGTPSPWKPDIFDLTFYFYYLLRYSLFSNKKILLLGATRELRELMSFFSIPYDLVDLSKHMENITKPERRDSLCLFLEEKWENLQETENYSLILGDLILNLCNKNSTKRILNKNDLTPLIIRVRIPTKQTYEYCLKKVTLDIENKQNINLVYVYSLLANIQTLEKVFNKTRVEILTALETSNQKKLNLSDVKNIYLEYAPDYFLHSEKFIKENLKGYISKISFVRRPRAYLDHFAFIIRRK